MLTSDERYQKLWNWTKTYIDYHCIWRQKPGEEGIPGKIPNTWYSWQFYLRRGLFHHEFLVAVSKMFLYKIHQEYNSFAFQITGLETASTPLLAGIPLVSSAYGIDINSFSVRKNRKEYGLKNIIEGRVNDLPILMLDDMCNSTGSLRKCLNYLLEEGHNNILDSVFCIVNKTNKDNPLGDKDKYLPESFKIISLFTLEDFGLVGAKTQSNSKRFIC